MHESQYARQCHSLDSGVSSPGLADMHAAVIKGWPLTSGERNQALQVAPDWDSGTMGRRSGYRALGVLHCLLAK